MKPGDTIQVVLRNQMVEAQVERQASPELFVVQTTGIYVLTPDGQATNRFVVMVQPTAWAIGDAPPVEVEDGSQPGTSDHAEPLPSELRHYKLAPYAAGSGQWRTACGRVVQYDKATLDRGEVNCPECRASSMYCWEWKAPAP